MARFSNASMGEPRPQPNIYRELNLPNQFDPSTSDVLSAYIEDVYQGEGSLDYDLKASSITESEQLGQALTEKEYKESDFYRPEISFYQGMTQESARALSENADDVRRRALYINNASTAQDILGFSTALATGVFEPKNFAIGIGTAVLGGTLANRVIGAKRILKAYQKYGKYKTRAAFGGVEGLVAAAIAEPSNRDSAKTLQQEYTLADSLFNVALSTTLGAGLNVAPAFIKEKFSNYKHRATEEVIDELDTAASQLAEGKRIDVEAVSKINRGDLKKQPISVKAREAEVFVKYTDTPEFKSRFEGSKIVDAENKPLRVFHGTTEDFRTFSQERISNTTLNGQGFYFTDDPSLANRFAVNEGGNVRPAYLDIKNPKEVDPEGMFKLKQERGTGEALTKSLKDEGFDGIIFNDTINKKRELIAFTPEQIIPAFGEGRNLDNIVNDIDANNIRQVKSSVEEINKPDNSTAYSPEEISEFDGYKAKYPDEMTTEQLIELEGEIELMREQGLLDDESLRALNDLAEIDIDTFNDGLDAAYICLTRG